MDSALSLHFLLATARTYFINFNSAFQPPLLYTLMCHSPQKIEMGIQNS